MKDLIEITLIWLTHILWLLVIFIITGLGLATLRALDLSWENSVCTIYGYILGLICANVIHKRGGK